MNHRSPPVHQQRENHISIKGKSRNHQVHTGSLVRVLYLADDTNYQQHQKDHQSDHTPGQAHPALPDF
ncbi:MAG: hypothetical protein NTW74_18365 [Acidobacteria bacterium]|nr:hypothetical protein [Acidobacteriota bacterium]